MGSIDSTTGRPVRDQVKWQVGLFVSIHTAYSAAFKKTSTSSEPSVFVGSVGSLRAVLHLIVVLSE